MKFLDVLLEALLKIVIATLLIITVLIFAVSLILVLN